MSGSTTAPLVSRAKEYFQRIDAGDFAAELFTPDFQFYFPKYGTGRGAAEFRKMAVGVRDAKQLESIGHDIDNFLYVEQGNHVVVEGTTMGSTADGSWWKGGETAGGRFCSVFAFDADGLIERMHIYLDPDYTGKDVAGFVWADRTEGPW
jgi:hypothetical protein